MNNEVYEAIRALADQYAVDLKKQVDLRMEEMKDDDTSHYLLYRVLGVSDDEGNLIDLYQFTRIKDVFFTNMPGHFWKRLQFCA